MLRILLPLILGYILAVQGLNYGYNPHPMPPLPPLPPLPHPLPPMHPPPPPPYFPPVHPGVKTIKLKPIHLKTEIRFPNGMVHVIRPNKGGYGKKHHAPPMPLPIPAFGKPELNFHPMGMGKLGAPEHSVISFEGPPPRFDKGLAKGGVVFEGKEQVLSFPPNPISFGPFKDSFFGGNAEVGMNFGKGSGPVIVNEKPVDAGTIVVDAPTPKLNFKGFNFQGGFGKNAGPVLGGKGLETFFPQPVKPAESFGKAVDAGTIVVDAPAPGFQQKGFIPQIPDNVGKGNEVFVPPQPVEQVGKPVDAGTVVVDVGPDGAPIKDGAVRPIVPPIAPIDPKVDPRPPIIIDEGPSPGRGDIPGVANVAPIPEGVVPTFPALPPTQAVLNNVNTFEQRFSGSVAGPVGTQLGVAVADLSPVSGFVGGGAPGGFVGGNAPGGFAGGIVPGGFVGGNAPGGVNTIVVDSGAGAAAAAAAGATNFVDSRLGVDVGPPLDPAVVAQQFGSRFGIVQQAVGPNLSGVSMDNVDASILKEIPNQSLNVIGPVPAPATSAFVGTANTVAPVKGGGGGAGSGGQVVVVEQTQNTVQGPVNTQGGGGNIVLVEQGVAGNQAGGNVMVVDNGQFDNLVGQEVVLLDQGTVNNQVGGNVLFLDQGQVNGQGGGNIVMVDQGTVKSSDDNTVLLIDQNGGGTINQDVVTNNEVLVGSANSVFDVPTSVGKGVNSLVDIPMPLVEGNIQDVNDNTIINMPPPSALIKNDKGIGKDVSV